MSRKHQPTIVLLAALHSEIAPVLDKLNIRLKHSYGEGKFGDMKIIAKVTGMGGKRAIDGLKPLLENKPTLVIHAGFAGGLVPALKLGDLLHISTIVNEDNESVSLRLPNRTTGTIGRLVTVNDIADTPKAKEELYKSTGAQAVDMESFYVGKLCMERKVHITALRIISDPVNTTLPAYIANWIKPNGETNYLRVAIDLLLRPWRIPTVKRIGRDFKTSGDNLAKAIISCIEQERARLSRRQ